MKSLYNNSQQSSTTVRKYSQVTSNKQDLEDMKDSIIKSITAVNGSNQVQIKMDKEALKGEIKRVEDEVKILKVKQIYIDIDKMRLLNASYPDDHIKKIHEIYKFHGVEFDLKNAVNYNKDGGFSGKKNANKSINYV
jgi:hypothetical protein